MKPTNCPNPVHAKALLNTRTNDLLPLPCRRWTCPICGPARSWRLGTLAAHAWPERWITLTKTSEDVTGSYKALSRLCRSLRRRSYGFEYLAVPERHKNGWFHLHLLQKGSFIPQRELSYLSERSGMGRICHIEALDIEDNMNSVAKYLVKYMTKDPEAFPKGVNRYAQSRGFWGMGGKAAFEAMMFPKRGSGEWSVVHLGSAEIHGDDGTTLWMGGTRGDLANV
jgi:hypothetical protein